MNEDIILLFGKKSEGLALYEAAQAFMLRLFPDASMKVSKTQVSFSNRYGFAIISPATRRIKGREGILLISFGLDHRTEHPRIVEAVQPYPGRWTHHVLINSADELDTELERWLKEAYDFSMIKARRK